MESNIGPLSCVTNWNRTVLSRTYSIEEIDKWEMEDTEDYIGRLREMPAQLSYSGEVKSDRMATSEILMRFQVSICFSPLWIRLSIQVAVSSLSRIDVLSTYWK